MFQIIPFLLVSAGITAALPFALILSQYPAKGLVAETGGLDFARISGNQGTTPARLQTYRARDGAALGVRVYPAQNAPSRQPPLMVMVHGSGWHGLQFDALARHIADSGLADVVVPDLRGHGPSPIRRGDIDHIGQFEEDLADLIALHVRPGQEVIMLGHSSGGGLVVRFAGGDYGHLLGRAILLAPFLGHDTPTTRKNSGGWAKPLVRRIIGLTMLNAARIRALNGLTVIQFRFPRTVLDGPLGETATRAYSYRLNRSYAPRPGLAEDAARLPDFLLLAGTQDEAFHADMYEPTLGKLTGKGEYVLIRDTGHLDLVDAPATADHIAKWLNGKP